MLGSAVVTFWNTVGIGSLQRFSRGYTAHTVERKDVVLFVCTSYQIAAALHARGY